MNTFSQARFGTLIRLRMKTAGYYPTWVLFCLAMSLTIAGSLSSVAARAQPTSTELNAQIEEARRLHRKGVAVANQGDREAGVSLLEQAIIRYREAGDPDGVRTAYFDLAQVYYRYLEYDAALTALQHALVVAEESADKEARAQILKGKGLMHKRKKEFALALEAYEESISLYRELANLAGEASVKQNIAEVYRAEGNLEKTEANLLAAFELSVQAGGERSAGILNNLAGVYLDRREFGEALRKFALALRMSVSPRDDRMEASIRHNMGEVYRLSGDYETARRYYLQALTRAEEFGLIVEQAVTLKRLAEVNFRLGRRERAQAYLASMWRLAQKVSDPQFRIRILMSAVSYLEQSGDYERALTVAQAAFEIAAKEAMSDEFVSLLEKMSELNLSLGNTEAALHFVEALHSYAEMTDNPALMGSVYYSLARLYFEAQMWEDSLANAVASLEIAEKPPGNRKDQQHALTMMMQVHNAREEYDKAHVVAKRILALVDSEDRPRDTISARNNLAMTLMKLGEYEQAQSYLEGALQDAKTFGSRRDQWVILDNLSASQQGLGHHSRALDLIDEALEIVEEMRTLSTLDQSRIQLIDEAAETYEDAILLALEHGQAERSFEYSERAKNRVLLDQLASDPATYAGSADPTNSENLMQSSKRLASLEDQYYQLKSQLGPKNQTALLSLQEAIDGERRRFEALRGHALLPVPLNRRRVTPEPLKYSRLRSLLPPNLTLLSYHATAEHVVAFVITRDEFQAVKLPDSLKSIRKSTEEFRRFSSLEQRIPKESLDLYDSLVLPVRRYLMTERIAIIPEDVLTYLPFGALHDGQGFFGESHDLTYLPNASVIEFLEPYRQLRETRILAAANPARKGFSFLRFAKSELEAIREAYGNAVHLEPRMTESWFKRNSDKFDIVHVAAHGQFNTTRPLFSRIVLAADEENDGFLEVHEIRDLDLHKVGLVVLSACQTQVGQRSKGGDVTALSNSFLRPSGPVLLATLWNVDDQVSPDLMAHFYVALRSGRDPARALRVAQEEVRKNHANPYYWAGYVVVGLVGEVGKPGA